MQQFIATISATLTFTREEVECLALCAEHHYDHTVNMLVPPGPDAIINSMRNGLLNKAIAETEGCYSFRQIDLLHKAIEFENDIIAMRLKREFRKALAQIEYLRKAVNDLLAFYGNQDL